MSGLARPSSRWQAEERKRRDNRGHGFISFASDGSGAGDHVEVYTFVHEANQTAGAVTLALDYESRSRHPRDPGHLRHGPICRSRIQGFRLASGRQSCALARCRLRPPNAIEPAGGEIARYNSKALPQLFFTR